MQYDVQWFPGHMAKARRQIGEALVLVDAVIEVCDARLPLGSRNADLSAWLEGKPRVIVMGKADLADPATSRRWCAHFTQAGDTALAVDSRTASAQVRAALADATSQAVERAANRGMKKTVRAMVVGAPNTGKSTLINALKGRAAAKTADRPGVTRGRQWISASPYLELLDTPGVLPPKIDDHETGILLALLGFVRDAILDQESLAVELMRVLRNIAPASLEQRCKVDAAALAGLDDDGALLEEACIRRGFLLSGKRPDTARGAAVFLDEFRRGAMGRLTLESPP